MDWKEIWDANKNIFIVSGWEECTDEKKKVWHLPSQYSYYSSGDLNLRVGIIAAKGAYKEEDFLLGGVLWGSRLGNGARTVVYFVAQDFSPVFLGALSKLGGTLSAKAVYWRERLTPGLFPVLEKDYYRPSNRVELGDLRPNWDDWERQLNPVAWNHLNIIRQYMAGFSKRRVRTVFEKNKIIFCWGPIEIAEIKKKGHKFDMVSRVKWTRNKSIVSKFQKSGWVDLSGQINDDFCRAISGIIELLENMEMNGTLDLADLLSLRMMHDKDFVPFFFGQYQEYPWISKERSQVNDTGKLYFYTNEGETNIVYPILEKPLQKMVDTILAYTMIEYCLQDRKGACHQLLAQWNKKLHLLCQSSCKDELRLCQSWLKYPENYPIIILPEEWKTEGFKCIKGMDMNELDFSNMGDICRYE